MKRFEYSLQTVLNVREAEKKQAEQEYSEIQALIIKQEAKMNKCINDLKSIQTYRGGGINYFLQKEMYHSKVKSEIKKIKLTLNDLNEQRVRLETIMRDASKELLKIETVKEQEYSVWKSNCQREEQINLDEIGLQFFMRHQKDL